VSSAGTQLTHLPDDVDALKAIVARQDATISTQASTISEQSETIAKLEHNVEVFRRLAFGPSTERRRPDSEVPVDANQGHLFYAELLEEAQRAAEQCGSEGTIEPVRAGKPRQKKKRGRRKTFPPHCPVVRTTYEVPEAERVCDCGGPLHEIGEDVRRELERIEMTVVHEIACKKYACRSCTNGVRTAPGPHRVIEKGILGKGFLAHVVVERFLSHMPYYRLEKKYESEGLDLSRSVLQRSTARVAELLEPISDQLRREVLSSAVIHTDDTPVTIAQASDGNSRQGRTWVYLDLEGRHFYDFTESRSRDGPMRILKGFQGYIQADAYPGYDRVFVPGGATEVACWAHARRKYVAAESSDPKLAKEAIDRIREIYRVEKAAADLDAEARRELRQRKAKPLVDELGAWLELTAARVLPKSPMGVAIQYTLNQWEALIRYLDDGRLAIDNNAAERALRPFAVGRKNWLFFQQDTGGRTAAILASLLQTAKAVGIDPRTYLRDVLTRISECSDVTKLTPHGWKEHFAEEVAERRDLALRTIAAANA